MPPFLRRIHRLLHIFIASGAKTPASHPEEIKRSKSFHDFHKSFTPPFFTPPFPAG
jgi:hypothetical protein